MPASRSIKTLVSSPASPSTAILRSDGKLSRTAPVRFFFCRRRRQLCHPFENKSSSFEPPCYALDHESEKHRQNCEISQIVHVQEGSRCIADQEAQPEQLHRMHEGIETSTYRESGARKSGTKKTPENKTRMRDMLGKIKFHTRNSLLKTKFRIPHPKPSPTIATRDATIFVMSCGIASSVNIK